MDSCKDAAHQQYFKEQPMQHFGFSRGVPLLRAGHD